MKTELTPTEENALRVKIAEFCEWYVERGVGHEGPNGELLFDSGRPRGALSFEPLQPLPNYPRDLAAVREALGRLNTGQSIHFVQELSLILGKDQNSTSAWEIYCTTSYQQVCGAVFSFISSTAEQQCRALEPIIERKEHCVRCNRLTADWVDTEQTKGRCCRECEAIIAKEAESK